MTENEFLNREITTWGFDYVESLLERGYEPMLTSKGWTWNYAEDPVVSNVAVLPLFTAGSLALAA